MKHLSSGATLGLLLLVCMASIPAAAQTSDLRVFKPGTRTRATVPQRIDRPIFKQRTLSHLPPSQLSQLSGKQVGQTYNLRLGHLTEADLGSIILFNVMQVQNDSATLDDKGSVLFFYKPAPNGQGYLSDCIVAGAAGNTLTLSLPGGQTESWKFEQGEQKHLTFLVTPDLLDKLSAGYFLTLKGTANWGLYSCSVSLVQ